MGGADDNARHARHASAATPTAGFDPALKAKTSRSILWLIGETVLEQAFSFLIFILMARMLPKAELGTFAIVFVIMDMGRAVAMAGVFQRIARARSLSAIQLDTIFWINVGLGALYSVAMLLFAHYAQSFFQAPLLEPVTQWMTVALMIAALGNTHMALRLREFGHRTLAIRSLIAGVIGAAVAVAGIVAGYGIWAFVMQRIVREVVVTILAWNSFAWRPRFAFDWAQARADIEFGKDIVAAQLVGYLTLRSQDLIIAKFMGPVPLSSFRVAWRSAEMFGPQLVSTFSIVALQTFSRLQDNAAELRVAYRSMLRNCALLTIPALVGYGAAGAWLVPALFGEQWQEAGWIALTLIPLAIPFAMTYFFQSLLTALGHAAWQRQMAVADLISTVIVSAIAVHFGLMWVAIGYALRAYLWIPVQIHLIRKVSGIGFRDHLWAFAPSVAASIVMGVAVAAALAALNSHDLIKIGLVCAGGALLYALIILALVPDRRRDLLALARRARARR